MSGIYDLYPGATVDYGGTNATVIKYDHLTQKVLLEVNGTRVWAKLNGNIFEEYREYEKRNMTNPLNGMVEDIKEDMAKRDEKIKEKNKVWSWCSKKYRQLTNWLNNFLRDKGVKSVKQLQSKKEQDEYTAALDERYAVRSEQTSASNELFTLTIDNFCDACDLMKYA